MQELKLALLRNPGNKETEDLLETVRIEGARSHAALVKVKILDAKSVQGTQFNRNLTFAENSIHDKKLKEAEEYIQAAERLDPDSPKVLLMHARLLQTMGDLPKALEVLEQL